MCTYITNLLTNAFPGLCVATVEFIGEGMDSQAYVVNKEYVFRFPKRQEVGNNLQKEIALLPYLQNLPLAVPDFTFVGHDPATGWPFAGYRLLQGEALDTACFNSLQAGEQQAGLQLIGRFLTALHRFDVELALSLGVEEIDCYKDCRETYQELKTSLYPCLTPAQRRVIDARFNSYLNHAVLFAPLRALTHSDFSTDHILCDPVSGQPQGIIDFGDVAVSDPDLDLRYLYQEMGGSFIRELLRLGYYQPGLPEAVLMEKLEFYNFYAEIAAVVEKYKHNKGLFVAAVNKIL